MSKNQAKPRRGSKLKFRQDKLYLKIIKNWLLTTKHKNIGALYLWLAIINFFLAGGMALIMRAELAMPGESFISPNFFNQLATLHGLIMQFGVIMPALIGLAIIQIPIMLGVSDMAMPKSNRLSFWILAAACIILLTTLLQAGGGPNFGATLDAPLSTKYAPPSTDSTIFAIYLICLSSIIGALNIITTITKLECLQKNLINLTLMPIFVSTWLITAYLLIYSMLILAGAATMLFADRHFDTNFFDPAGGGNPALFQHIFQTFAYPEVYALILPAIGIISEIIPKFSNSPLINHKLLLRSIVLIALLTFIASGRNIFIITGKPSLEIFFMYVSMLIAVPTSMVIGNWLKTMQKGVLTFSTSMLFAIAGIIAFIFAGLTGLIINISPANIQYQETYFIVGHTHYLLVFGVVFAIFAAIYYWLPEWLGKQFNKSLASWHFWSSFIAINFAFFPMFFLGLEGMPRRVPDYALQFANFNLIISIGSFIFGFSQILFFINIIQTICKKPSRDLSH